MKLIVEETGVNCEEDALKMIARAAEGGMRDALSLLDQAISFSQESVTVEDALTVTGSVSQGFLNKLARSVLEKDVASGLEALEELLFHGKDPSRFIEDFILYYRDMLLYKTAPNLEESLDRVLLDEDFRQIAESVPYDQIYQLIELLNKTQQDMRWTNHPRIFLEVAIVKLCQTEVKQLEQMPSGQMAQLFTKIEQLEHELQQLKTNGPAVVQDAATQTAQKPAQRSSRKGFQPAVGRINDVLKNATKNDLNQIKSKWGDMRGRLMKSHAALLNEAEPAAASANAFILKFKHEIHCQMAMDNNRFIETITLALQELTGNKYLVLGVPEEQWVSIRENFLSTQHQVEGEILESKPEEEPHIAEAKNLFGAEFVEIID
jgi:DNA polymerase-3 subunit gamma/tau